MHGCHGDHVRLSPGCKWPPPMTSSAQRKKNNDQSEERRRRDAEMIKPVAAQPVPRGGGREGSMGDGEKEKAKKMRDGRAINTRWASALCPASSLPRTTFTQRTCLPPTSLFYIPSLCVRILFVFLSPSSQHGAVRHWPPARACALCRARRVPGFFLFSSLISKRVTRLPAFRPRSAQKHAPAAALQESLQRGGGGGLSNPHRAAMRRARAARAQSTFDDFSFNPSRPRPLRPDLNSLLFCLQQHFGGRGREREKEQEEDIKGVGERGEP